MHPSVHARTQPDKPAVIMAGSGETILPKPGLLFLFPSWLQHQVRPYRGTELRISIAFNLGV